MPLRTCSPRQVLVIKIALASVCFSALTGIKTSPLIWRIGSHIPGDFGDPALVIWILAWGFHAMTTDPWNLFNANIFYPVENTLALSEHMIAVVPFFGLPYFMTGNPVFAYNVVFLLSFVLCGISMFLLVHHWTESFWASILSGCLFAFAPIRFTEISHLQLNNFYWAPLAFLFLDRFIYGKRWPDLAWFAVFYWLQVLCSVYLGWFLTVAVGVYLLYSTVYLDRNLLSRTMIPRYAAFIVSSLIVLLPFHMPYYRIKQLWGLSTLLQDCVFWSADPLLNYLSPPHLFNDVYLSVVRFLTPEMAYPRNEMLLFPSFVVVILAGIGSLSVAIVPRFRRALELKRLFGVILIASFLLSLGPVLVVLGMRTALPLPYQLFYYLIPGFQAMRVPARFAIMVSLAASVLAGLGFLKLCHGLRGYWPAKQVWVPSCEGFFALVWIGLFMVELGFKPLPLVSMPTDDQVPGVYRWLATKELHGPILELPLDQWESLKYMYFSTYHWLPLVNGASGYTPQASAQLSAELKALPARQAVELLSALGVKGVILHADRLEPREASQWQHADLAEVGLEELAHFGSDVVYKLIPVETTPQLHVALAVPDQLPEGEMIKLPQRTSLALKLLADVKGHRFWTHPQPLGRTQAIVEWQELQTGKILLQQMNLTFPMAIKTEEVWSTVLALSTPPLPGRYALSVFLPAFDFKATPKLMEISSSHYPESALAPHLLSAVYVLEEPVPQAVVSREINIILQALNTGRAVWLAHAKDDRGAVRLGWRWFKGKEGIPSQEGREWLRHDVFPGQEYRFKTTINPPSAPGDYRLEVGLVSELVTWFSDRGVPPLTFAVNVQMNINVGVQNQTHPFSP